MTARTEANPATTAPPEVTVVIPTHNRWYLARNAIKGALGQRDVATEVLVIDDGSSDETPLRLGEVDDPRLRVIRHERPAGVARARNRGIAEARGEWVAFLDDDDLWSPRKLRVQLDTAAAETASFVWTRNVVLDERRRAIRSLPAPQAKDIDKQLLLNCVIGGPSSVMAKTELLRHVGGFDERFSSVADWDLWIRLSRSGVGAACPEPLVGLLEHGSNMLVTDTDPDRVRPEFERLAAKHGASAAAAGVDFGWTWIDRWPASRHRLAGHRLRASQSYLVSALRRRSLESLLRAAVALLPKWAWELGLRARMGALRQPDWLSFYEERESADPTFLRPGT